MALKEDKKFRPQGVCKCSFELQFSAVFWSIHPSFTHYPSIYLLHIALHHHIVPCGYKGYREMLSPVSLFII